MTAGELVFTGRIVPDRTAGEDVAAQARSAFSRLTVALAECGLNLEDLLRLRLFVGDLDDLSAIERAIDSFGPVEWPAVSVIEPPTDSAAGVAVTLDAVAAHDARQRRRVVRLSEPDGDEAHSGLGGQPRSVRLGSWVFVGATAAAAEAVPASSPSDHPGVADSATRRIDEESREVFAHIAELLRAQGAELCDVVSVGGWLTFPMRDYGPLGDVREALVAEDHLLPASAAVQVSRVRSDGALLAFEAIAFAPEDRIERERWRAASLPAPSPLAPYYVSARSAGGYVFTCGEVPAGTARAGRPARVQTQAEEVYARLRSHLVTHGATPADVIHQTVFVRRSRDHRAVAEAGRTFYGADAPPPTTLLGAADIGFHPGCDVEIELVAAVAVGPPMPDDSSMDAPDALELDPAALSERERYFLLTSVIVPRPIAWVSTLDGGGRRNLAPYSYFNACSATPPIVHFTSTTSRDSIANVRATGEFVVNIVSDDLAKAMRVSSAALHSGEDEFEVAGLEAAPSLTVSPPRVARAKVALECRLRQLLEMGEGTIVFGDVLHVHVERSVWRDGQVDPTLLRPVGRLSGLHYTTVSDVYSLELPDDVRRRAGDYGIRGGPAGPADQADPSRS